MGEGVQDLQVGDLVLVVVAECGVGGVGVGEFGVTAGGVDRSRGQQRCFLRNLVSGTVDVPVKNSLPIGRQQRIGLGGIQCDRLDFRMAMLASGLGDKRAQPAAERQQFVVVEIDFAVDNHPVLI